MQWEQLHLVTRDAELHQLQGSDDVEMALLLRLHEAVYMDPPCNLAAVRSLANKRIEHGLGHYFIRPMTYYASALLAL